MSGEGTKQCKACGSQKPISAFGSSRRHRDGLNPRCRACVNAKCTARYWAKRPEGRKKRFCPRPMSQAEWAQVIAAGRLKCRSCGREKPLSAFAKHWARSKVYYQRACRECSRVEVNKVRKAAWLKSHRCKKHGIAVEHFDELLRKQNGKCAVCGFRLLPGTDAIDHDHETGQVRGIVHRHCNLVLGNAHEDIFVLGGAIEYLLRHIKQKRTKTPAEAFLALVSYVEVRP